MLQPPAQEILNKRQFIEAIQWNPQGLVCAIIQDASSYQVLMQAWMSKQSLELSLETGYTHFWSRSRGQLWKKGETSGHVQKIISLWIDCDADTLIVSVEQTGAACHTGAKTCFYRQLNYDFHTH